MKNLLYLVLACIAVLAMSCNRPNAQSETKFPAACGGYTDYRVLSDDEVALFDSIYSEAAPALKPYAVATQVVAGTNYRFLCHDDMGQEYVVTIFVPLPCYADSQQTKVTNVQFPFPQTLVGTWTVRQLDDIVLTEDSVEFPQVTFSEDGAIYATAGCNGMGGNYTYENGKLTIHDGMCQTEMWCENEEMMRNERWLAETLVATIEVSFTSSEMVLLKGKHNMVIAK